MSTPGSLGPGSPGPGPSSNPPFTPMAPPPPPTPPPPGAGAGPVFLGPRAPSTGLKVAAILSIVFGALCCVCMPVSMGQTIYQRGNAATRRNAPPEMVHDLDVIEANNPLWIQIGVSVAHLALGLVLMASGIGTLRLLPWARTAALVYAAGSYVLIVVGAVNAAYQYIVVVPQIDTPMFKMIFTFAPLGLVINMIYPLTVNIVYMRRSVKDQFAGKTPSEPGWNNYYLQG